MQKKFLVTVWRSLYP